MGPGYHQHFEAADYRQHYWLVRGLAAVALDGLVAVGLPVGDHCSGCFQGGLPVGDHCSGCHPLLEVGFEYVVTVVQVVQVNVYVAPVVLGALYGVARWVVATRRLLAHH